MSASQRKEAHKRAVAKGCAAALAGMGRDSNPYKPLGHQRHIGGSRHGAWSLYPAWDMGYSQGLKEKDS